MNNSNDEVLKRKRDETEDKNIATNDSNLKTESLQTGGQEKKRKSRFAEAHVSDNLNHGKAPPPPIPHIKEEEEKRKELSSIDTEKMIKAAKMQAELSMQVIFNFFILIFLFN
jgi:hypothetical protein